MSKTEKQEFKGANVNPDDLKPKEPTPSFMQEENDNLGAYLKWQQAQYNLLGIPGFTTDVPNDNPALVASLQWLRDRGVPEPTRVRDKIVWPGSDGYGFEVDLLVWDVSVEGDKLFEPVWAAEYLVAISPKTAFRDLIDKGVMPKSTSPVY